MKNNFLKLILLLTLVFALAASLASCEALGFLGDDSSDNGDENSGNEGSGSNDNGDSDPQPDTQGHTHSFSDWMVTSPSTCIKSGEMARVCFDCFERESTVLEKADHSFVNSRCTVCEIAQCSLKTEAFDYSKVPAHSEEEYVIVNENVPFFTADEIVTVSYESYGEFDALGRCTAAMACIGKDIMPDGPRGSNPSFKPTGWVQAEYSFISGKYLYNRCHLIAWQLSAETTNRQNLITGTKYMNQAMIEWENDVADYINKNLTNHVMFRVTPIFLGDNLLAEGILLEAYSVEDNGEGISLNMFFYNVQPGVEIDYATGVSQVASVSVYYEMLCLEYYESLAKYAAKEADGFTKEERNLIEYYTAA